MLKLVNLPFHYQQLNFSDKNLSVFPENVFEYPNLTKLVLSNNRIKVIPKEILKLNGSGDGK